MYSYKFSMVFFISISKIIKDGILGLVWFILCGDRFVGDWVYRWVFDIEVVNVGGGFL